MNVMFLSLRSAEKPKGYRDVGTAQITEADRQGRAKCVHWTPWTYVDLPKERLSTYFLVLHDHLVSGRFHVEDASCSLPPSTAGKSALPTPPPLPPHDHGHSTRLQAGNWDSNSSVLPSAPVATPHWKLSWDWPHYPFRSRWWSWFRALVFKLNTTTSKSQGRTLSSNWHRAVCVKQWQEAAYSAAPSPFGSTEAMGPLAEHGKCPYVILTWRLATPVHGHQILLPTSGSSR